MNLTETIYALQYTSETLKLSAAQSVNAHLTVRNWLLGYYIVNYELNGSDRASYGDKVIESLAAEFTKSGTAVSVRTLNVYRQFYIAYPQLALYIPEFLHEQKLYQRFVEEIKPFAELAEAITVSVVNTIKGNLPDSDAIWQTSSAKLQSVDNEEEKIEQTASAELATTQEEANDSVLFDKQQQLVKLLAGLHPLKDAEVYYQQKGQPVPEKVKTKKYKQNRELYKEGKLVLASEAQKHSPHTTIHFPARNSN